MTTVTPLGRSVSVDDWKSFQGDVALKMLYDYGTSGTTGSLTVENLYQGSAMGMEEAREVALYLAECGFATVDGESVQITDTGKMFTAACIDERFHSAEQIILEVKMTKQMNETNAKILKQLDAFNERLDRQGIPGDRVWSAEPPRAGEWDAPDIIGWAFRGTFVPPEQMASYGATQATSTEPRPLSTSKHGVVVELMATGPDGLPLWAQFRQHLFGFHGLRGEWCPVRIGEPNSRT